MSRLEDLNGRLTALRLKNVPSIEAEDLRQEGVRDSLKQISLALVRILDREQTQSAVQKELTVLHSLKTNSDAEDGKKLWDSLARVVAAVDGAGVDHSDKLHTLERLIGHVQAARIKQHRQKRKHPSKSLSAERIASQQDAQPSGTTSIDEATQALQEISQVVKARGCDSAQEQLVAIHEGLDSLLQRMPRGVFDPLIPENNLSETQRKALEQIFSALWKEYAVRRKMLIERAKVTLQSMLWSKEYLESKGTLEKAKQAAQSGQEGLLADPEVQLSDVFQARIGDILAVTCKASSGDKGKFEATVKSVLIGAVPDRGGRPAEGRSAAAAASMPAWAPRSSGGGRHGGRSGSYGSISDQGRRGRGSRGKGHRGGRVQEGWQGRQGQRRG